MSAGTLVVSYPLTGRSRAIIAEELYKKRGSDAICINCLNLMLFASIV
jgi:hypothetical protein